MDPSIRLKLILEGLKVDALELQPSEWLSIVSAALTLCRPQLKYFPGFEPVSKNLNCFQGDYDDRVTDLKKVQFPKGFTEKTRCVSVATLLIKNEGASPGGRSYCNESKLLLTQEGRLIRWDARYSREVRGGLGFRAHRSGTRETAEFSKFSYLKDADLLEMLTQEIAGAILEKLDRLMANGVAERKRRLENMERVSDFISGMRNRIRFQHSLF